MVPFDMLGMVSYYCPIVIVRRTVFEIFDFKNAVTLKPCSGSFKVIEDDYLICHPQLSIAFPVAMDLAYFISTKP